MACLSLGGKFGWNTMRLLDYFIELEAGPEMHDQLNALEASWDSPEVIAAYQKLKTWVDNGWIVPGFLAVSPDDARQPFYRGQAAMVFEAAAVIAAVEQFLRDTLPPAAPDPAPDAWLRAARHEAVGQRPTSPRRGAW